MESLKYTRWECKYHAVFIPETPEESFVWCLTATNGECVEQHEARIGSSSECARQNHLDGSGLDVCAERHVRTILSIAGPSIIKEFQLSETEMGAIYSAFLFSYALLMLPGGYLTDLWGPKITLAVVGLGSGVLTGLTGFAATPGMAVLLGVVPSLMLVRLCLGVCTAPIYPACARMNVNWTPPKHRARVQGLIVSGAGLGGLFLQSFSRG